MVFVMVILLGVIFIPKLIDDMICRHRFQNENPYNYIPLEEFWPDANV
jgi:hypothetical protein